jgi:hypothetical protein
MGGPQHAVSAVNTIVNDEEIVVLGELVFVYAVHAAFGRCAAESVTCWYQAGEL